MKNKFLKVFATLSLLAIVVAGCEDTNSDTNSVNPNTSDTSGTNTSNNGNSSVGGNTSVGGNSSVGGNTSEAPVVTEYNVRVEQQAMSTVTTSATKAPAGETVTVTVTPDSGFLVLSVTMNGKNLELNQNADGTITATFAMPNTTARISVSTDLIDKSGIVITGEVTSAKLVEEVAGSGIYVARNIEVTNDSIMGYTADGGQTLMSIVKIDNAKTFANIDLTNGNSGGFEIAGNAIYDFYYDSNDSDTPCYIQRVGVINLPTSAEALASLLYGRAKSESTVYPANVNHVEYTSETANISYKWDLYSNNSSYASITDLTGRRHKGLVYKAQEGNKYSVVNTYLERTGSENYKRTKVVGLETIPFSGKFDVVSSLSNKYSYTQDEVNFDANFYSHSTSVLDMEFYDAYRTGLFGNVMDDVEVAGTTTVTSEAVGTDGDFKVKALTWARWENSTYYDERNAYKTFELEILFTKSGALKEATYMAYTFDDDWYDFSSKTLLPGAYDSVDPDEYTTVKYGYGAPKAGQPKDDSSLSLDLNQYFVSNISDVTVKGKNSSEGSIGINEIVDYTTVAAGQESSDSTKTGVMKITYEPATALDSWQYQIVATNDESIVGLDDRGDYIGKKAGDVTVTIGNKTVNANDVTKDVAINVSNAPYLKYIFMYTVYEGPNYNDTWGASNGIAYAGRSYDLLLAGTNINGGQYVKSGMDCTFEILEATYYDERNVKRNYDVEELAKVLVISYNNETGMMRVDATAATSIPYELNIKVVIYSPHLTYERSSEFSIKLIPGSTLPETLVGTWNYEEGTLKDKIVFAENTGSIYLYDANGENEEVYNFSYTYDSASGSINAEVTSISGAAITGDDYELVMTFENTGKIGVGLYAESMGYDMESGNYTSTITKILGAVSETEDGVDFSSYVFFAPAK